MWKSRTLVSQHFLALRAEPSMRTVVWLQAQVGSVCDHSRLCKSALCFSVWTQKLFRFRGSKRKKECTCLEMSTISALEVTDEGRSRPPQRRRARGSSCPSLRVPPAFLLLLRNASRGVSPSILVTRGAGCICFCAFFLFKNNVWFVCFYTIQISWLPRHHCSHTVTPSV